MLNFAKSSEGNQPGYHFYADPEGEHWYDTVWDIIKGLFMAFKTIANSVSAAWDKINAWRSNSRR